MKKLLALTVLLVFLSCGGDDGPPPSPGQANLLFPLESSECTTGVDVGQNQSQVTFEWSNAVNTDTYTLTVLNLNTNIPQEISTGATSIGLSIEKGAPFSWSVRTSNMNSDDIATSESWLFYNAGTQTTYAPFPARILGPISGASLQLPQGSTLTLEWQGADVEDDIAAFQVYFGAENPPSTLVAEVEADISEFSVNVAAETTYYWKVVTTDSQGNTSDSGIFDFRVL